MTGLAAMFAASVAMIGRSTAAALGVAFAYMLIFENLVRAWKPWSARFLIGENGAMFITGADLETADLLPVDDDRRAHPGRATSPLLGGHRRGDVLAPRPRVGVLTAIAQPWALPVKAHGGRRRLGTWTMPPSLLTSCASLPMPSTWPGARAPTTDCV